MKGVLLKVVGVCLFIGVIYFLFESERAVFTVSDSLYEEIKARAGEYSVPAEDARIDSVWKAIPGIEGKVVDVAASYRRMKGNGKFAEEKLVYKAVAPKVHLADLEAAPVYRGNGQKKMVALTVNVAWGNEYLPEMIATLKETGAEATFFLEGRWAKNNPDLARMLVEEGFEVGNHSYSHPDMSALSSVAITEELEKTNNVIKAVTKQEVKWFAPPSGSWNNSVVEAAKEMGLETIMWTVDTIDWQKPSAGTIVERVVRKAENGVIVLMHPTEPTAAALETMIKELQRQGYKVVDISTLLDEKR